ncbi:MAG: hypothetical protein EU539_03205 [Promethearchaeota archaeon]|nr:MAG: hypothetical protein EU539_03205 [Candidatus Lokiarchaeota archaeon]
MKSKDKFKQTHIYCPECGILISVNTILKNRQVCLNYIFCPECGKKVKFQDYSIKAIESIQFLDKKYTDHDLNNSIELIISDKDFSERFRKTFTLFIARMSYVKLKEYEKEVKTPIFRMCLTTKLLKTMNNRLIPIIIKGSLLSVIRYLDNVNYSGFFSDLKQFQRKIRKQKKIRKAFFVYLRWIIEIVFKIMNRIDSKEGLFNYEKAIRDDLVQLFGLKTRLNIDEKEKNIQCFPNEMFIQDDKHLDENNTHNCSEDQIDKKPVWFSALKNIITEMVNEYGPNFLEKFIQKKITWKDIQKKYSKRKIRNRIVKECNLKTLDATKTMSPWLEPIFLEIFGEISDNLSRRVISELWASPKQIRQIRKKNILPKIRKMLFYELDLFKKFFPDFNCSSIKSYSRTFNINPNAMAKYLREILENWLSTRSRLKRNTNLFQECYNKIWYLNWEDFQAKKITYDAVKKYIETRKGALRTTSFQWNEMKEYPANRKIKIECSEGHTFFLIVTSLLNRRAWCYECRERKCESIFCMYMDKIFKRKFIRQANLGVIYNLPTGYSKEITCDIKESFRHRVIITRQTFDCYEIARIQGTNIYGEIIDTEIKLGGEYDGIQHDKYVKNLHRGKIENYYKQRCRDIAKEMESDENNTIIIRLKESNGFDLSTLNKFHQEIVWQFQKLTGIKLPPMFKLIYDIKHNCLKITKNIIDIPLSSDS